MAQIKTQEDLVNLAVKYIKSINEAAKPGAFLQHIKHEGQVGGKNVVIQTNLGITAESFKSTSQVITASTARDGEDFEDDEKTDDSQPVNGVLSWSIYRSKSYVSGRDAAASGNNEKLFVNNLCLMAEAIVKLINKDVYTGSEDIVGLDQAIGDDKNVYAGIDRNDPDNLAWRPSVFYKFGPETALTIFQIRDDLNQILSTSGERPDFAFVHPSVLSKITSQYDPQKQYVFKTKEGEPDSGHVMLDGCMFIEDYNAPPGRIYYLNSKYVSMKTLGRSVGLLSVLLNKEENHENKLILGMCPEMLSKTGDSDRIMLKTYPQLVVERPNTCGVRYNIV